MSVWFIRSGPQSCGRTWWTSKSMGLQGAWVIRESTVPTLNGSMDGHPEPFFFQSPKLRNKEDNTLLLHDFHEHSHILGFLYGGVADSADASTGTAVTAFEFVHLRGSWNGGRRGWTPGPGRISVGKGRYVIMLASRLAPSHFPFLKRALIQSSRILKLHPCRRSE